MKCHYLLVIPIVLRYICAKEHKTRGGRMRMKHEVCISWFQIRLGLFLLLISVPQWLSAQEKRDSARIILDSVPVKLEDASGLSPVNLYPEETVVAPVYPSRELNAIPDFSLKKNYSLPYQTNPSLLFRGDYSTSGVLRQFPHGAIYGSGSQRSLPGIGLINDATLGYQHIFSDKLSMQLNANAMKINMIHSTRQAFSTSGALLYRPSERITFKVFGSYDIGDPYGMSTHHYGATMSVGMSDRFSMEMGVQRYYDAMRGRWETVPVVIPYYRFEKFNLGLDVGGVLYEILRGAFFDKDRGGGSPTIGPPRFSMPIR